MLPEYLHRKQAAYRHPTAEERAKLQAQGVEVAVSSDATAQPRTADGRFGKRPGKSAEDALMIIALSGALRRDPFTVRQYIDEYHRVVKDHPELGFDTTIKRTTAMRDLSALYAQQVLMRADTKTAAFEVTPYTGQPAIY